MTKCSVRDGYRRFGGIFFFYLQGRFQVPDNTASYLISNLIRHSFLILTNINLVVLIYFSLCLSLSHSVCGATAQSVPGPSYFRGFYITHNDTPQSVGFL
jgi:hypothetical protein